MEMFLRPNLGQELLRTSARCSVNPIEDDKGYKNGWKRIGYDMNYELWLLT